MSEYMEVIQRYETARQLVGELKTKRNDLISSCENLGEVEYPHGSGNMRESGKLCLVDCWEEVQNHGGDYGAELQISHDDGACCDSCWESYEIKTGPLAAARKEFGNAKRQLSNVGKKIIKNKQWMQDNKAN